MKRLLPIAFSFLLANGLHAQNALTVDSSHDGNGLFIYQFSLGTDPYVWGVSGGNGSINIRSQHVLDVSGPADWMATIMPDGWVSWEYQGIGTAFLGEPTLTFSILSASTTPVLYDGMGLDGGPYFRGLVLGNIYDTPTHTYQAGGYVSFSLIGPAVIPEPGTGALWSVGLAVLGIARWLRNPIRGHQES